MKIGIKVPGVNVAIVAKMAAWPIRYSGTNTNSKMMV